MTSEDCRVYHERQKLQFCLLHALNNLFQENDAFTRANLNATAEKLVLEEPNKEPWTPLSFVFKPHHNTVTGNYDITIEIELLQSIWMGLRLLMKLWFDGIWNSRHWDTPGKINELWYNLDSDLLAPHPFKDIDEVRQFLDHVIGDNGEILFVINDRN
ncbi:josephin-like protein [Cucurbita moschata]|uniref:ubiquitinyl hydrolase 1 n=1 Tax=Cucurbita moschata TaxID=3662 RepID=A0A6J1G5H0_CUCMO|nr:josephin-like protein [Cucurbita moschata]XP_022947024.1 josephin-like protein [Cucurbita moschata]